MPVRGGGCGALEAEVHPGRSALSRIALVRTEQSRNCPAAVRYPLKKPDLFCGEQGSPVGHLRTCILFFHSAACLPFSYRLWRSSHQPELRQGSACFLDGNAPSHPGSTDSKTCSGDRPVRTNNSLCHGRSALYGSVYIVCSCEVVHPCSLSFHPRRPLSFHLFFTGFKIALSRKGICGQECQCEETCSDRHGGL